MTFLRLRFALTAACCWRPPWPGGHLARRGDRGHLAVAGILMHGVYLGGVFMAIRLGLRRGCRP